MAVSLEFERGVDVLTVLGNAETIQGDRSSGLRLESACLLVWVAEVCERVRRITFVD